jgi:hypothetical protein
LLGIVAQVRITLSRRDSCLIILIGFKPFPSRCQLLNFARFPFWLARGLFRLGRCFACLRFHGHAASAKCVATARAMIQNSAFESKGDPNTGLVEETYADREPYITKSIADLAKALNLSAQDFAFARASAATWFFVGPCRGDARLLPNDAGFAALQVVALADPARPDGAAILEIIAILTREGFDKPSSIACQYAKKLAVHQPSE